MRPVTGLRTREPERGEPFFEPDRFFEPERGEPFFEPDRFFEPERGEPFFEPERGEPFFEPDRFFEPERAGDILAPDGRGDILAPERRGETEREGKVPDASIILCFYRTTEFSKNNLFLEINGIFMETHQSHLRPSLRAFFH
jgi:hypothetical protein